jgi:predicted DNA repair protein MutK
MFLVGGGILAHGLPVAHHAIELAAGAAGAFGGVAALALDALLGIVAGTVALAGLSAVRHLRSEGRAA